jgi:hypothetical protein
VQRRGNGRRQQVPPHHSGYSQRQQCLKTPKRYEPEKHADRRAQCDRVTGIFKLQELPTLFAKPSKRVHWVEVIGLVSAREHRICLVVIRLQPNRLSASGDNSLDAFSVCARIQEQFLDFSVRRLAEHLVPMANRIKGVWLDDDDEFIHRLLQFIA